MIFWEKKEKERYTENWGKNNGMGYQQQTLQDINQENQREMTDSPFPFLNLVIV